MSSVNRNSFSHWNEIFIGYEECVHDDTDSVHAGDPVVDKLLREVNNTVRWRWHQVAKLCRIGHSDQLIRERVPVTGLWNTGALPLYIKYTKVLKRNSLDILLNCNSKEIFYIVLRLTLLSPACFVIRFAKKIINLVIERGIFKVSPLHVSCP